MTQTFQPSTSTQAGATLNEPFLVMDQVTKIYPALSGPNVVIKDVNLTVNEGEFICIIGHSGCGKSTLLNTISGFATPDHGEVRMRGKKITNPGPDRMVVFQNYSLMPWLTAYENVYLALDSVHPNKSHAEKDEIVMEHLTMVGLGDAIEKKPPQLSGGMKQRVAIARAFCLRPQAMILDEPFGALDAITKEEMQEELSTIVVDHRCTVLMVTHDVDECLFLADKLVMMTNGPAAGIGEILEIPFPRPRDRAQIMEDPRYYDLRNQALDFLYNRFAHDDITD
jgi:nitrate ABC transporter ATP-binding subunit